MREEIKKYLEENLKINVIKYNNDAGYGTGAKIQVLLEKEVISEDFLDME